MIPKRLPVRSLKIVDKQEDAVWLQILSANTANT